jgi:hypothetical protein
MRTLSYQLPHVLTLAFFLAPPATAEELTAPALETIWQDLTRSDEAGTKQAYQDICLLIRHPAKAVPFLREHLKPVPRADDKRIAQWINDLDSDNFTTREKATTELEKVGILAQPALKKKLEGKSSSLEVRRRMERILDKLDSQTLSPAELRSWRAVEVLEGIGTPEARQVIAALAQGAPGARQTEDARRALDRLAKRP